jgi:hypothetical protein
MSVLTILAICWVVACIAFIAGAYYGALATEDFYLPRLEEAQNAASLSE